MFIKVEPPGTPASETGYIFRKTRPFKIGFRETQWPEPGSAAAFLECPHGGTSGSPTCALAFSWSPVLVARGCRYTCWFCLGLCLREACQTTYVLVFGHTSRELLARERSAAVPRRREHVGDLYNCSLLWCLPRIQTHEGGAWKSPPRSCRGRVNRLLS